MEDIIEKINVKQEEKSDPLTTFIEEQTPCKRKRVVLTLEEKLAVIKDKVSGKS